MFIKPVGIQSNTKISEKKSKMRFKFIQHISCSMALAFSALFGDCLEVVIVIGMFGYTWSVILKKLKATYIQ